MDKKLGEFAMEFIIPAKKSEPDIFPTYGKLIRTTGTVREKLRVK